LAVSLEANEVIPASCKRLIEVDFPIAAVSAHSAREKSGPQGHHFHNAFVVGAASTGSVPRRCCSDCSCPTRATRTVRRDFKTTARELLAKRYGSGSKSDEELRELLLKFIGEFCQLGSRGQRHCIWKLAGDSSKPRIPKKRPSSLTRLPAAARFRSKPCGSRL
jgi:hypothetical protein